MSFNDSKKKPNAGNKYEKFMSESSILLSKREKSISELTKEFNKKFQEKLSEEAFASRIKRYRQKQRKLYGCATDVCDEVDIEQAKHEYEKISDNGTVEAFKIVKLTEDIWGDERKTLSYLGYDPDKWTFKSIKRSFWNQKSKGKDADVLYGIQLVAVKRESVDPSEYVKAIKEVIGDIEPLDIIPRLSDNFIDEGELDDSKLMEICPVELHLGKMAYSGVSGQDYELEIAKHKFEHIFDEIFRKQREEHCGRCLIAIGSDFFNSESDNCTSVHKIPQANVAPYKILMQEGFKLYAAAITTLRTMFHGVDVILCAGNHARSMEFFLYFALQQYFKNDFMITFREDYKETQAYRFGNCAIFYNHGDYDLKRTIKSIPAEFYDIWGKTIYRELHLGHLHKEMVVDDEGGMITRRVGSPTGTDEWHYQNRFVGAVQKHEIFIWDSVTGLQAIHYINTDQVK